VCDEPAGHLCCQRQGADCCQNRTLILELGVGTPIKTIDRPQQGSVDKDEKEPKKLGKESVVGVGVGFSIAAFLFITIWAGIMVRKRRRDKEKHGAKPRAGANELDGTEMQGNSQSLRKHGLVVELEVVELESPVVVRGELDSTTTSTFSSSRFTGDRSTLATSSEGTELTGPIGTLVTPQMVELEAPYKKDDSR